MSGPCAYTERFRLDHEVTAAVLQQALDAIAADLSDLDGADQPDVLVGMGGAVTNLAAVMHGLSTYDPDRVQGTVIDRSELDRQIELYRAASAEMAPADRGPSTEQGRGDPGRGVRRGAPSWTSWGSPPCWSATAACAMVS